MHFRIKCKFLLSLSNDFTENCTILGVNKIKPLIKIIPKPMFGTIKTSETIPRLLLRQSLLKEYPLLDHVLCDFKETCQTLKDKKVDFNTCVQVCLENECDQLGFSIDAVHAINNTPSNQYTVMKGLLYRLLFCQKVTKVLNERKDYKNVFRMQLFVDTHIDLCNYISFYGVYDDRSLLDPESNKESGMKCALDHRYPTDDKIIFCGDLPDLTPCIDIGNIWYDIRPRFDTLISALVHVIMSKTQPHKCQLRNFARILKCYFERYPIMISMYRQIIAVGLLGNYPHAKFRPCFQKRIKLSHFIKKYITSDEDLCEWISRNERLVYYLTKEYYVYCTEQQYTLDSLLIKISHWQNVKDGIKKAMDTVRSIFSRSTDEKDPFSGIEAELKHYHELGLNYLSKLRKMDFSEMIYTGIIHYTTKNEIPQRMNDKYFSAEEQEYLRLLGKYLAEIPPRKIQLYWIKCFGITEKGYSLFMDLFFKYELMEEADHAMARHLNDIFNNSERDFYLIFEYVRSVNEAISFQSFDLSSDYTKNHLNAIRKNLQLLPYEELKPEDDSFWYCAVCKKWSSPFINDMAPKTYANVYAQGLVKTLYDKKTNKLFCGKRNAPGTNKKNHAKGVQPQNVDPCVNSELICVSMIGKLQRLDKKLWALCEVCGKPTQWEGNKFSSIGFTCIVHRPKISQKEVMRIQNVSGNENCCFYCSATEVGVNGNHKSELLKIKIIDDSDGSLDYSVKNELICVDDFRHIEKWFEKCHVGLKSFLIAEIMKERTFKGMGWTTRYDKRRI
jgi:hypothetical protein